MNPMYLALVFLVGSACAVPPAGVPVYGGRYGGVAVVPAGLTRSLAAEAAAKQQLLYQIAQARGAAIQDAFSLAQQSQSLGNQIQNSITRDTLAQANAERVLAANNWAQNARNALAQARDAQIQIAQSNSASSRNAAIQLLQGNNAGAIQTNAALNELAYANALGVGPFVLNAEPVYEVSGVPEVGNVLAAMDAERGSIEVEADSDSPASRPRGQDARRGPDGPSSSRRGSASRNNNRQQEAEDSEAVEATPAKSPAPTSSNQRSSHLSASSHGAGWGRKSQKN